MLPDAALCLNGVPSSIEANAGVILFVDQIADGKALLSQLRQLQDLGVEGRRLRLITALCSSPGLKLLGEQVPDLTLHTACIDEAIDDAGQISPGIGEPVRRLNLRS